MSDVRTVIHTAGFITPSVMSAGNIQRQDLFDDDDDENAATTTTANTDCSDDANCTQSDAVHTGAVSTAGDSLFRCVLTMILLTCVNLLNYMDRFSVAGYY